MDDSDDDDDFIISCFMSTPEVLNFISIALDLLNFGWGGIFSLFSNVGDIKIIWEIKFLSNKYFDKFIAVNVFPDLGGPIKADVMNNLNPYLFLSCGS